MNQTQEHAAVVGTVRDSLHAAYVERTYAQAREEARSIANDPAEQAEIKAIAEFFGETPWPAE